MHSGSAQAQACQASGLPGIRPEAAGVCSMQISNEEGEDKVKCVAVSCFFMDFMVHKFARTSSTLTPNNTGVAVYNDTGYNDTLL